ncbi:sulfatase [Reichenbachiella carrageenanivorans]|uniref:Sulfatase n=1 Tax=Reichenbachiella carrageenanivorans TaxID=2979869 RepID=A0ABY6D4H5_9BACT|nr:sulfatase [Reichenbachiella carrageenanivorans]UXX81052.1 sulfatase [Reichenbachiella carrageenanivorans]
MNTKRNGVGLLFLILVGVGCRQETNQTHNDRPNIIFMMADDHAYQAISAYQDHLTQTPNIDRIAKEGMIFRNACVTNSVCAPSRAVVLTGKHSHINGKTDNIFPFDTAQVTFPQYLQAAGYQTAMFGKLHFGNNPKGFDEFKILPGQGAYYNPDFITKKEGNIQVEGYVTDIITDMTLNWLENERNKEEPFMLMYLHKAPHREWLPALRHIGDYTSKKIPEPTTLFDDYSGRGTAAHEAEMNILEHMNWAGDSKVYPDVMDELGIPDASGWDQLAFEKGIGRMTGEQRTAWDNVYRPINEDFKRRFPTMTTKEKMQWRYQRYMQDYLATIAAVDQNVGRVLDYLDENGLAENTLIVYTSDQGFYLGEHGWFDKRFIYEESFRTPLLMRWPQVIKPESSNQKMVQNLDFAQTLLEVAGVTAPGDMQGESLVPLLEGREEAWTRNEVYYHFYEYPSIHMVKRHYGIVSERYKLIHFYYDIDEWELYDRKMDPQELNNVFNDPAYAEVVRALKTKLEVLRKKYGDSDRLSDEYIERYMSKIKVDELL